MNVEKGRRLTHEECTGHETDEKKSTIWKIPIHGSIPWSDLDESPETKSKSSDAETMEMDESDETEETKNTEKDEVEMNSEETETKTENDSKNSFLGLEIPKTNKTEVLNETTLMSVIQKLFPTLSLKTIQEIWKILEKACFRLTPASYKSIIQKIIRFRGVKISIHQKLYDAPLVLVCVSARLILHPGSFVPDIQQFVSGIESMTKRLSVIILEDSYVPPEQQGDLSHLLSSAFLAQRSKNHWKPSLQMVQRWLEIAVRAQQETRVFEWKNVLPSEMKKAQQLPKSHELGLCKILLNQLGSLEGDYRLIDIIDQHRGSMVSTYKMTESDSQLVMPWEHFVDQHCLTGVLHYLPPSTIESLLFEPPQSKNFLQPLKKYQLKKEVMMNAPLSKICNEWWDRLSSLNPRRMNV